MSNELTIFRGDNADIECAVTDKDGAVVNITGASISFTVRDMQDDTQQFQCTTAGADVVITNGAGGLCEARVVPADTLTMTLGSYVYDFEFTIATKVFTVSSIIEVKRDVTHA